MKLPAMTFAALLLLAWLAAVAYITHAQNHARERRLLHQIEADNLGFGQPAARCEVPGHNKPKCKMNTCASFDANGNVTGNRCNLDCAESCCGCTAACNRHHENPDEENLFLAVLAMAGGG